MDQIHVRRRVPRGAHRRFNRGLPVPAPPQRRYPQEHLFAGLCLHFRQGAGGSGRWEIGSGGNITSDAIPTGPNGQTGSFFSDAEYLASERRAETAAEQKARIDGDLTASLDKLETALGHKVGAFAFTLGDWGQKAQDGGATRNAVLQAAEAHYPLVFAPTNRASSFSQNYPGQGRFIREIEAWPEWTAADLLGVLEATAARPLPASGDFGAASGWRQTYGDVAFGASTAFVAENAVYDGGGLLLPGSRGWRNYKFSVNVGWQSGNSILLFARYQDAQNYVGCKFTPEGTLIQQETDGTESVAFKTNVGFIETPRQLAIEVAGNRVACVVDGEIYAASSSTDPSLGSGGIGLKAYDRNGNPLAVTFESYAAVPLIGDPAAIIPGGAGFGSFNENEAAIAAGSSNPNVAPLQFPVLASSTDLAGLEKNGSALSVPVLLYHGVNTSTDGVSVTPADFEAEMEALKADGWNTISIYDYDRFIQGRMSLPKKSFLLTFDDGRKDSYYPVDPVLKKLGYRAVMFVIMDRVNADQAFYLTAPELKTLAQSGRWNLQSHGNRDHDAYAIDPAGTIGHFMSNLFYLPGEGRYETPADLETRIANDLQSAKTGIEDDFGGGPVVAYAFPFGDYGQETVDYPNAQNIVLPTVRSIYDLAFYQADPAHVYAFNYPNPGQLMQKRIVVFPDETAAGLVDLLDSERAKPLPYRAATLDPHAWLNDWGALRSAGGSLEISAETSTTGGADYLSGSEFWRNYSAAAAVNVVRGESVGFVARAVDPLNYVSCDFDWGAARIEEVTDGSSRTIGFSIGSYVGAGNTYNLGIRVDGSRVTCSVDGKDVVSASADSGEPARGGIGFSVWSSVAGSGRLLVRSVDAEPLAD